MTNKILIGLDIETDDPYLTDTDTGKEKARGYSFHWNKGSIIVVGVYCNGAKKALDGADIDKIKQLLTNSDFALVGCNIMYDICWLLHEFKMSVYDVKCDLFDISIAESFIDEYQAFSLDALAEKYLKEHKGYDKLSAIAISLGLTGDFRKHLKELWDKGYKEEIREYVLSDADQPVRIFEKQAEILKDTDCWRAFEVNSVALKMAIQNQMEGVRFDYEKWQENCKKAKEIQDKLKSEFESKYGSENINSTKQLAVLFDRNGVPYPMKLTIKDANGKAFVGDALSDARDKLKRDFNGVQIEKGKLVWYLDKPFADNAIKGIESKGYTVLANPTINKNTFKELIDYQLVKDLIEYKQVSNIITKFLGKDFERFICPIGDEYRIYSHLNITGARQTSRCSCSNPNSQQIPSKTILWGSTEHEVDLAKMCRECFVANKNEVWLKMDFSGEENRILAHFSLGANGKAIQDLYNADKFLDEHKYVSEVSGLAKEFGAKIGRKYSKACRFGLVYSLGLKSMCKVFGWEEQFAKDLIDKMKKAAPHAFELMEAVKKKVLQRRYVKTLLGRRSHLRDGRDSEVYKFLNYLIQGSGGDILKLILQKLYDTHKCESMTATVHDEINWTIPNNEEGIQRALELNSIMEDTVQLKVPLVSNPEIGTSFANIVEWSPEMNVSRETFIRTGFEAIKQGKFKEWASKIESKETQENDIMEMLDGIEEGE